MKAPVAIGIVFALCAVAHSQAPGGQATPPPLPSGPLLQKEAPTSSQWVETCVYPPDSSNGTNQRVQDSSGGQPKANSLNLTISVTKGSNGRREIFQRGDGSVTTTWDIGNFSVLLVAGRSTPFVFPKKTNVADFYGLDWIAANTYVGQEKVKDRVCLVFHSETEITSQETYRNLAASNEPTGSKKVSAVAYIDLDTRLPINVQIGDEKRTYQYSAKPEVPLIIPSEIQSAVDAQRRMIERAQVKPPPA